jgi:hypothetical protein
VIVIALLARIALAIVAVLVTDRYTIPDETLYLELGRNIVHGISPNEWYPGYGQSLYDSIETYSAPLVLIFRVFGSTRLVGALFAAVVGAAAAGVTVAIALRFLRPAFALIAGLVVALVPSQVLFSAVVLREGHIWLMLTVVGLGAVILLTGTDWQRLALGATLSAAGLLGLAYLRDQTMLAAAWALAIAVVLSVRQMWPARVAVGLVVALAVPWIAGSGPGGWNLVRNNADRLAQTRATLAVDANSAFGGATPPPVSSAAGPNGTVSDTARDAANRDDSVRSSIRHLPAGLVDVTLRPFPWSSTAGSSLLLARVETIVWYLLYALTVVGVLVSIRRREARLALEFPVLLMGMLLGIAALTQGNLGTAFRHREQILWVLALCAAAGLQWLVLESRWGARARRSRIDGADLGRDDAEPASAPAEGVLTR